ncbi:hypothetical protein CR203_06805 [Salipaludibacillus neizhouensis]|uniref:Uncharacterized protein n=1 Tax=Salipaludibacillus neizhouensis TaxID=885475 RepID=A0A3A9KCG9_9BACI|nr:hypothetical protein CR203_06805 [Salipaludibacillus neizhouensis]
MFKILKKLMSSRGSSSGRKHRSYSSSDRHYRGRGRQYSSSDRRRSSSHGSHRYKRKGYGSSS